MDLTKWFTDKWCKYLLRVGPVNKVEIYSFDGVSHPVHWVNPDDAKFRGQTTIIGSIILSERAMNKMGDKILNYAFLHEVGHKRNNILWKIIAWLRPAILLIPAYLVWMYSYPIWLVFAGIGLTWVIWFLDEIFAERFAAKKLGEEAFNEAAEIKKSHSDDLSIYSQFLKKVAYPPPWLTTRLI